jgi:hypothetical protein
MGLLRMLRRLTVPAAVAGGAAVLLASGYVWAQGGGGDAVVLGQTPSTPKPVCPTPNVDNPPADRACQAMGRVTGFQVSADGRQGPYKIRRRGRIVAWSVSLGRPNKEEQEFFLEQLQKSGPASARLSVLKPKGEGQFTLRKQSPIVQLGSFFGESQIFTLRDPLKVKKGLVVALTTTYWVPNLGLRGTSRSDSWRASRAEGECGSEPNDTPEENERDLLELSRPQQKVGGTRSYACLYRSTRLLYKAYLDPR